MKIHITFLLLIVAVTASAVTLNWSANGSNAAIKGLTSGAAMSTGATSETASLALYYFKASDYDTIVGLGKVQASALSSYVVAETTGQTSDSSGASGRVKASSKSTDFTAAGATFFARAYATFSGTTYFIDLFGGAGNGGVWEMTKSGDQSASESLAWVAGSYGGSTSETVGTKNAWISTAAVPEPATGALALAGIALLFKRRKACA